MNDKLVKELEEKLAAYAKEQGATYMLGYDLEAQTLAITMGATYENGDSKQISAAYGPEDFAQEIEITAEDVIAFIDMTWTNS